MACSSYTGPERTLDLGEFVRALARLRLEIPAKDVSSAFEKLDASSTGIIKFGQMQTWLTEFRSGALLTEVGEPTNYEAEDG